VAQAPGPAESAVPVPEPSIPRASRRNSLLLDAVARGNSWVAVGERGHILVSHDRGATWTQSSVPTRMLLTGVWMHDDRLGWAVGHDETILRTRDGGAIWERVYVAPEAERPLLDVWFRDAENGLAVGALRRSPGDPGWGHHLERAPDLR